MNAISEKRLVPYRRKFKRDLARTIEMARQERVERIFKENAIRAIKRSMAGEVYLIEANGLHKIGYSGNASERIKNMRTAIPCPLVVICIIPSKNAKELECSLHERFALKRAHGEWFNLSPDDIEYIKGL